MQFCARSGAVSPHSIAKRTALSRACCRYHIVHEQIGIGIILLTVSSSTGIAAIGRRRKGFQQTARSRASNKRPDQSTYQVYNSHLFPDQVLSSLSLFNLAPAPILETRRTFTMSAPQKTSDYAPYPNAYPPAGPSNTGPTVGIPVATPYVAGDSTRVGGAPAPPPGTGHNAPTWQQPAAPSGETFQSNVATGGAQPVAGGQPQYVQTQPVKGSKFAIMRWWRRKG